MSELQEKLNLLKQEMNKFHSFVGFDMEEKALTIDKKMHQLYFQSLLYMRSIYLLEFSVADTTGFFDIPDIKELYHSISQTVARGFQYYPPIFIQNLANSIQRIFYDPVTFADFVDKYFSSETINSLLFAYSTFPAIFGYFITTDFCEPASKFLVAFFNKKRHKELATDLIKSFFKAIPVFNDNLFYALAENFNKKLDFKTITLNAVKTARPHITKWHIEAATTFMKNYVTEAIDFFVNFILLKPFISAAYSCSYFSDKMKCKAYAEYLKSLQSPSNVSDALELMDTFLYTDCFSEQEISISKISWYGSIPIILSCNDAKLMYDILTYTTNNIFFFPEIDSLPEHFNLFVLDLFLTLKTLEIDRFGKDLFGKEPKTFQIEKQDGYERIWNFIVDRSKSQHQNPEDIIETMNVTDDLKCYVYSKILFCYEHNFRWLEKAIVKEENCRKLVSFTDYIRKVLLNDFHDKTVCNFETKILKPSPIAQNVLDEVNDLINNTNPEPEIFFELVLSALDSSKIYITEKGMNCGERFFDLLGFRISQSTSLLTDKLKILEKIRTHVTALKQADWTIGKMVRQMIYFETQLQQIVEQKWPGDPEWTNFFAYGLFANANFLVFPLFIFVDKFIFSYCEINNRCPDKSFKSWITFSAAMWELTVSDESLLQTCNDSKSIREFFTTHQPK